MESLDRESAVKTDVYSVLLILFFLLKSQSVLCYITSHFPLEKFESCSHFAISLCSFFPLAKLIQGNLDQKCYLIRSHLISLSI
jgi:hypothetical protein